MIRGQPWFVVVLRWFVGYCGVIGFGLYYVVCCGAYCCRFRYVSVADILFFVCVCIDVVLWCI